MLLYLYNLNYFLIVDFSLYDALTEIKHCRKQIIHRDEDIAKLISQMNDLVSHLSLVEEENAAFKFNNGIVCVDMVPLRDERALKIQYLTKERDRLSMLVDSLGATVVDLKKNIGLMSHREKDLTSPFINLTDGKEIEIRYIIPFSISELHCSVIYIYSLIFVFICNIRYNVLRPHYALYQYN